MRKPLPGQWLEILKVFLVANFLEAIESPNTVIYGQTGNLQWGNNKLLH